MNGNTAEQLTKGGRRRVRLDSGTTRDIDAISLETGRDIKNKSPHISDETIESLGLKPPIVQEPAPDTAPAHTGQQAGLVKGPVGIDIGTTSVVVAQNNCKSVRTVRQMNAFFAMPVSKMVKKTLKKNSIDFFDKNKKLYILGSPAEEFATMHGASIRRPVESGLINPQEEDAVDVIKAILDNVVRPAEQQGEKICFSVPADPVDGSVSTVFHESVIKMHLRSKGYTPLSIHEGLSVVFSELADNNYTGIGISIGGGMCNVCLSYLAVPVLSFSIQKGGDYIDCMVSQAVGEPLAKVREYKETELDLSVEPRNTIETGLHIYYTDLFTSLLKGLQQVVGSSDKVPRMSKGIPLVLSGGSVAAEGCRELFEKACAENPLPIPVSEIRIAEKPLFATAKGLLKMAMEEEAE